MIYRNFHQVLLGIIYPFCNSIRYFVGFAKSVTNYTVSVAYHYNGSEGKSSTTFYNFGYTIDSYYSFF